MIETEVLDAIAEDLRGQCVHDIEFFCEERGINYDGCADALSQLECQIVNLKTEIANLKKK